MSKSTILLVGGAWHTADYLSPLAATLEAAGYRTATLGLPSVGADPSKPDFGDDVAVIRSTASRLLSEGKRIVGTHMEGLPATDALQGFGSASKKGAGAVLGLGIYCDNVTQEGRLLRNASGVCW